MPSIEKQLDKLTAINTQDFLTSFGLGNARHGRRILEWLSLLPARRFASQVIAYDRSVGEIGLQAASQVSLGQFHTKYEFQGIENLPKEGPLLVLSNHPGLLDTLLLFASLPRSDLKVIASERPFLQALPQISRRLIYVPEDSSQRTGVLRSALDQLKSGGALLTFPSGQIEPDPASMRGAIRSLNSWSRSIASLVRLVPEMQIVPAVVSGVVWPVALRHPLTRIRRRQNDRERLAAALQLLIQLLLPRYQPQVSRVAYGRPISANKLVPLKDAQAITNAIIEQERLLFERETLPKTGFHGVVGEKVSQGV